MGPFAEIEAAPALDSSSFREALGRFATGVALVTAAPDGEPAGMIVNSLTSISLQPPLVSFAPSRGSLTWSRMGRTGRFGVNVLGRQHERFAIRAAPAGANRFAGVDWEPGRSGVPLLTDALATLECEIVAEHPAGDHWIVVGYVDDLHVAPVAEPLIFFDGAFGALQGRAPASIMFTDLVGSTERAVELGDRRWSELLGRHLGAACGLVRDRGGEIVKTLGDGILALFPGPAQAVRSAEGIVAEAAALGLDARAGVHAGEVERTRDDVAGLAVRIAARIMSRAVAREVLVSRTVRDLVVGSELRFADRGEHELKGIPERWVIYATA